jgi:peptidyl-dipeptidase A
MTWTNSSTKSAATSIDNFVHQADPIWTALALARWRLATTGLPRYKDEQIQLRLQEHRLYEDPAAWQQVQSDYAQRQQFDPLLKRQIEVLHRTFLNNQSTAAENETLARLEGEIQEIYTNHRAVINGRPHSNNEITEILKTSQDEDERRAAWFGSKEVGAQVAGLVRQLAHLRNQIARRLGFRDHYHFALTRQEIVEDELFALFGRLAGLTNAPFTRLKELVDERLRPRLGLAAGRLAPWHYADPFFQSVPPVFDTRLDDFFSTADVAALSVRAYDGMGLEVRDILQRSDLYERPGKDQHAFCTRIGRQGDTRILCNLRPNTRWMTTQLHELGHAIYNKHLPLSLPYLLRTPAHTNSTEAIAMLMGRLSRNPRWLVEVAGGDPAQIAAAGREAQLELAAGQLIFARWAMVMLHFERAFYADPDRPDLNQLWWQLVEQFQHVAPPAGRDQPDWAAKYHLALAPVYYHNYVLGELTTSQLEQWIGRAAGDLVENPAAGRLLVEHFFRHGASHSWDKLIEVATGEPLQPAYFVNQFVPIFKDPTQVTARHDN